MIQRRVIARVLGEQRPVRPPLVVCLLQRFPGLQRVPAYLVGIGIRPEHVDPELRRATPAARAA